jgi:hypothetical protein
MQNTALAGLLMVCSLAALSAGAAEIKVDNSWFITLRGGDIDERTPADLERALNAVQPALDQFVADGEAVTPSEKGELAEVTGAWLTLDSGGGDVVAAMRAGEIARKHHVTMRVMADGTCASACVLLLAGGVERIIYNNVGIHRPYSAAYSASLSESEKRYKSISVAVDQLDLTRFCGHFMFTKRGIQDVQEIQAIHAGVPTPDGTAAPHGTEV